MSHKHTFPVGVIQHKVAEFCYCFCVCNRTHFNFPLVAQKSTRVAQVLENYALPHLEQQKQVYFQKKLKGKE